MHKVLMQEILLRLATTPMSWFAAYNVHAGRQEFVQYLPENTQGVIVQPLGSSGVLVIGTDTLRGLSRLDQVHRVQVMGF